MWDLFLEPNSSLITHRHRHRHRPPPTHTHAHTTRTSSSSSHTYTGTEGGRERERERERETQFFACTHLIKVVVLQKHTPETVMRRCKHRVLGLLLRVICITKRSLNLKHQSRVCPSFAHDNHASDDLYNNDVVAAARSSH